MAPVQRRELLPGKRRAGLGAEADQHAGEIGIRRRSPAQPPRAVAQHIDQEVGGRPRRRQRAGDLVGDGERRAGWRGLRAGRDDHGERAGGRRQPSRGGLAVHHAGHGARRLAIDAGADHAAPPVAGDGERGLDLHREAGADAHQRFGQRDIQDARRARAQRGQRRGEIERGGIVVERELIDGGKAHAPIRSGLHRDDAGAHRRQGGIVEAPERIQRAGAIRIRRLRQRRIEHDRGGLPGHAWRRAHGALVHGAIRQAEQHLAAAIHVHGPIENHGIDAAAGKPPGAPAIDQGMREMDHVAARERQALRRHLP